MTNYSMIKFLLKQPRFVYILEFVFGAYIVIELAFQSQLESKYLMRFVIFYIHLLILYNMTSAFMNTFALTKNVSDIHSKNKVRFYLQVLPFFPAVLGTMFVFFAYYFHARYFLVYRFVITLALVWLGNFVCAMYLACVIGIPTLIDNGEI